MSNNNDPATKQIFVGVAIAVISAVILAWLGLTNKLPGIEADSNSPQPLPNKQDDSFDPVPTSPPNEESSTLPNKPTTPKQSNELEVVEITLEDFRSEWRSNQEQIKDNFDFNLNKKKVRFIGYLHQNSIYDCIHSSEQITTRCMTFYDRIDASSALRIVFEPKNVEQTREINRLLYKTKGLLIMKIEGKLLFDDQNNFEFVDWQIVDYYPYQEK